MVDTHCHIHAQDFGFDVDSVLEQARAAGVSQLMCVGTDGADSEAAVQFVESRLGCFASIGLHPHDAKLGEDSFETLVNLVSQPKVVAIGECGLDYFYMNSTKQDQRQALEYQLQLATSSSLPCIFHVRDAFLDFWPILDNFPGIKGVIHSFTATEKELEQAMKRDLYVGLNGITTFTKDDLQLMAIKTAPLSKIVLETDSPFLTPVPKRGTVNVPANVELVAAFLASLRGEPLAELIKATTDNARLLFKLGNETL
jgi:TatD DNase family protein